MEYIGIDISKRTFDIAISESVFKFENTKSGFIKFYKILQKFEDVYCVCEATGGYELELALFLYDKGIKLSVVNPKKIKNFFRCIGLKAKTDTLDAQGIRLFAERMSDNLKLWEAPSKEFLLLKKYYRRREDLLLMTVQEKNRLSSETDKTMIKFIKSNIASLHKQLLKLEALMKDIIDNTSDIKNIYDIVMNIKGCGEVAAMGIIALMPEIGTFTRGEIASITGVAPFNNDSGTSVHKVRCIKEGRKHLRNKLYLPTISAMRKNEHIKAFADRLLASGKPFKKVVIASMRKLLIHINSQVKKYA